MRYQGASCINIIFRLRLHTRKILECFYFILFYLCVCVCACILVVTEFLRVQDSDRIALQKEIRGIANVHSRLNVIL